MIIYKDIKFYTEDYELINSKLEEKVSHTYIKAVLNPNNRRLNKKITLLADKIVVEKRKYHKRLGKVLV